MEFGSLFLLLILVVVIIVAALLTGARNRLRALELRVTELEGRLDVATDQSPEEPRAA